MSNPGRSGSESFSLTALRRDAIGRAVRGRLLIGAVAAALLGGTAAAYAGPCTAQIAQIEQQVKNAPPGPTSGPTFPQTLGAQLHNQPTPRDVEHAQAVANERADAALARAKQADAAGNAGECQAALAKARVLYGLGH